MAIIITYPSALEYWKTFRGTATATDYPAEVPNIPNDSKLRKTVLKSANTLGLSLPLHILVPQSTDRSHGSSFVCHVMPKNLPKNSYVQLTKEIYIISPECCYLMASAGASISDLAVLATELCSIYRINKHNQFGQDSRNQITSIQAIETYLTIAKNVKGIKKAKTALKYAFDRSNSPIESKLAVIASLPCMYGGFALPRPALNEIIILSKEGAALLNRDTCCCDMVWREYQTAVEYDSDLAHSSKNKMRYDKSRCSALIASDFKVIQATLDNFRNHHTVENLFALIRKTLGLRSIQPKLEKYKDVRFELIKKMFLMMDH